MKHFLILCLSLITLAGHAEIPFEPLKPELSLTEGMTYEAVRTVLLSKPAEDFFVLQQLIIPAVISQLRAHAESTVREASLSSIELSKEALTDVISAARRERDGKIKELTEWQTNHPYAYAKLAHAIQTAQCSDQERNALWALFLILRINMYETRRGSSKTIIYKDPSKAYDNLCYPWKKTMPETLTLCGIISAMLLFAGVRSDYKNELTYISPHFGKKIYGTICLIMDIMVPLLTIACTPASSPSDFDAQLRRFARNIATARADLKDYLPQKFLDESEALLESIDPSTYTTSWPVDLKALKNAFKELCAFYKDLQQEADSPLLQTA